MIGIALAVAVLIVVLSVMNGFEYELQRRILGMVSDASIVGYEGPLEDWADLRARVLARGDVEAAAPYVEGQAMAWAGDTVVGITVPTGETEFRFQVANLDFHSSAYQWLVVSGALAQYKGTGQINGAGNYGFLLTATDGQLSGGGGVDKFRIKIWDINNGGAIVYDNVPGASDGINDAKPQPIAGGSITIKK